MSGSVSRVLSRTVIYLDRLLPVGSSDLPAGIARARHRQTWSCRWWGLPCRRRHRRRGALLPHHFTIAPAAVLRQQDAGAVCFLWHFPWGCPRWPLAITVPCPARTFLPAPYGAGRPPNPLISIDYLLLIIDYLQRTTSYYNTSLA